MSGPQRRRDLMRLRNRVKRIRDNNPVTEIDDHFTRIIQEINKILVYERVRIPERKKHLIAEAYGKGEATIKEIAYAFGVGPDFVLRTGRAAGYFRNRYPLRGKSWHEARTQHSQ